MYIHYIISYLGPLVSGEQGDNLRRKEVRLMSKTLQHSTVILATLVALVAGSVAVPLTLALAASEHPVSGYCQSVSDTLLRSGFVPAACLNLK